MQLPLVVFTAQTQTGGLDASAEREGSLTGYVGVLCSCVGLAVGGEGPCPAEDSLVLSPAHVYSEHCSGEGWHKVSRGFEPRSLNSESRVLTVTPRDQLTIQLFSTDQKTHWQSDV